MIVANCGETTKINGRVKVAEGHVGPPGYDHEAILRAVAAKRKAYNLKRKPQRDQARVQRQAALLASLVEAARESNLGALTLTKIVTAIEKKHADVMFGDEYALYAGISKQTGEYAKAIRGEPRRFLWESKVAHKGSSNVPMVQWCSSWYDGRMSLNRGDLQWHG